MSRGGISGMITFARQVDYVKAPSEGTLFLVKIGVCSLFRLAYGRRRSLQVACGQ